MRCEEAYEGRMEGMTLGWGGGYPYFAFTRDPALFLGDELGANDKEKLFNEFYGCCKEVIVNIPPAEGGVG